MRSSSYLILKNFLKNDLEQFQTFLSPKTFDFLKKAPAIETPIADLEDFDLSLLLKDIHYSWFLPVFQKLPEKEKPVFLTVFKKKAPKIQKNLKNIHSYDELKLSDLAENYLKKKFLHHLLKDYPALLPKKYLPLSAMTPLLNLNKKQLIELIHFLALFDLSKEYFKIIDKNTLQKLNAILSEKEKQFLKSKRNWKDKVPSGPLHLNKFSGDILTFKALLHKRGFYRLSQALLGCYFDFIWHIAHTLDIGRGKVLLELTEKTPNKHISAACQDNILELLPLLEQKA